MKATLIDVMGDDLRVVNAARVSFDKESDWEWVDEGSQLYPEGNYRAVLSSQDQKLIKYLAKHNHWTPFSHVQITMRERVPIFVARQRFKHMVGFTYNEVSRRYVDEAPEFYVPSVWRKRAENKKQGSSDEEIVWLYMDENGNQTKGLPLWLKGEGRISAAYEKYIQMGQELYEAMIESGVAPEQARMVLPQSMMTEYYCTGSLAAWARAYKLRIESHAQEEIRDLAKMWDKEIRMMSDLKYSWSALTE